MQTVAIIPARGGSKRIPDKNIRDFCGKPIIGYAIEAARASTLFDAIIVSTDSDEIAAIAAEQGASVPFVRPAELANDHAGIIPVVQHAINTMQDAGQEIDAVCCIFPTVPLLLPEYLAKSMEALNSNQNLDFAFSVTEYAHPIQRALALDSNNLVSIVAPEYEATRTQDLPERFHDAGQFYWGTTTSWLESDGIFSARSTGIRIPRHRVVDIDTPDDWRLAEALYRALNSL